MKKIFIAGLITVLGIFFTIPVLAFNVNSCGDFYAWLNSDLCGTHETLCDNGRVRETDYLKTEFSDIYTVPVFRIRERFDSISLNSVVSVYTAHSVKQVFPAIFSVSDNYSDYSGLSFLGMNADFKIAGKSLWFEGIYGTDDSCRYGDYDNRPFTYLVAAGADADIGVAKVHGQFFYAAGNDSMSYSDKMSAFNSPFGSVWIVQPYYSAEIMGYGTFDNMLAAGVSPFDRISSVAALNFGASIKPMDKLTLRGDIWYAKLADKDSSKNSLGSEIDLVVTYELIEDLKFDIVGAYLFSGDSANTKLTPGKQMKNDNNSYPYELGARLRLSF